MKKVILLAPTPPPAGGIAGWTERMMSTKLKNDWTVEVVDEKYIGGREVFTQSIKSYFFVEIKRCLQIWNGLKRALSDPNAKVVHSCIPSYFNSMLREYICAGITKRRKRKFIVHFRCTVPNSAHRFADRFMLRRLCNRSDVIFALNEQSVSFLRKMTKTPIKLIPNFVTDNELSDSHIIKPKIERVLYVGGLVERKGVSDILKVAAKLPEVQFVLVGKGNSEFEARAKSEKLKNVVFAGSKDREGVKCELIKADAFLLMTYFLGEGFSNALCEAMAMGLPCVVTDWAANRDMVGTDGGVVVPVGDVDAAVKALSDMQDIEIRKKMSMANIQKVRTQYTQSVVTEQYVDAYESLIC